MQEKGTLYFFTGLAGAGKTTLGGMFYERLKQRKPDAVLMDGDKMRGLPPFLELPMQELPDEEITDPDDDRLFSTEARKRGAWSTAPVFRDLTEHGVDVVLCSIAMYAEIRAWFRENVQNYREIYVKVKRGTLYQRNQRGLYSPGRRNIVGVDLPWDEPDSSDVVLQNDGQETPSEIVDRLERIFLDE